MYLVSVKQLRKHHHAAITPHLRISASFVISWRPCMPHVSRQALIGDGRSSPLRRSPSGHRGTPRHTVTRTILHTTSDLSHEFRHSGVRGDGPDEVHAFFGQVASRGQDTDAFRVARMTPQSRLADSREGEAGRSLMRNRWIPLHRGLVITDGVRAELLNPMSHRFKLLRGAH